MLAFYHHHRQWMPPHNASVLTLALKNNTAMNKGRVSLQSAAMKRYLAIFLLVLLPLQFSWAAMAGYCQHETGVTAKHPGHHSHDHAYADHQESSKNTPQSAGMDHDCAACHLGCAAASFSNRNTTTDVVSDVHPLHLQVMASQPSIERPERPKWPVLA